MSCIYVDCARYRRDGFHREASEPRGAKALVVQPLDLDGTNRGDPVIAFDAVDAGVGDQVLLVTEGFSAMTSVQRPESPIDMAVVGVIDRIDLDALPQTPAAHRK